MTNTVTVRTNFNVNSASAGNDVWLDLVDDGRLTGILEALEIIIENL